MKLYLLLFMLFGCVYISAQTIIDFEEFNLNPESYLNGEDESGGFQSQDIFLPNKYNAEFKSWSGWAISNTTDITTAGYTNQYSAITGAGYDNSTNYATSYVLGASKILLSGNTPNRTVEGMYVTNSTYAYLSMKDGDSFAKKFGGTTGDDPDFFVMTIRGYVNGELTQDSVDFYLADFRSADNSQDYIVSTWQWVDLTSLGNIDSLNISLNSSDQGQFGMNTPAYFCMDQMKLKTSVSTKSVIEQAEVLIAPNPTSGAITIQRKTESPAMCYIYTTSGQILMKQALKNMSETIHLDTLPPGSYIVQLISDSEKSAQLIIKQ